MDASNIVIEITAPGSAEARKLIAALDAYQTELYPAESNHLLPIEALEQPNVTFLGARLYGELVGCAAFVDCGDYVEIKRMYVDPQQRGRRIGQSLLLALETRALSTGIRLARLETGIHQPEALGLYESQGYRYRAPFGDYQPDPLSIFMEKSLA